MIRKALIGIGLLLMAGLAGCLGLQQYAGREWPAWEAFADRFVQRDGRVIDRTAADRSTSEGQAYAMFFALVGNDPERFASVLAWADDNLAAGELGDQLPAWLWGQKDDGSWGVIDGNPASDADLWMAYSLLEAGRLWEREDYTALGRKLAERVAALEVQQLAGLGAMLLPAPHGFSLGSGRWRLNPSYFPPFQLRRLALEGDGSPWREVLVSFHRLLTQLAPEGWYPDWAVYDEQTGKAEPEDEGSYDAIRVYLWAALSHPTEPLRQSLLDAGYGMKNKLVGGDWPPERVNVLTGSGDAPGPAGFSGAVLPMLVQDGSEAAAQRQRDRLDSVRRAGLIGQPPHYYEQVLALFGEGWTSSRFKFDGQGHVRPGWQGSCCELIAWLW